MDTQLRTEIEQLFEMAHQHGLGELAVTRPEFAISITTMPTDAVAMMPVAPAPVVASPAPAPPASGHAIVSPIVGIFYRAPSPDAPPFVEVGDTVEVGQTIGIVEAMKVFNEIAADAAGTVTAIPAESGTLVQVDQPLVLLNPMA